MNTALWIAQIVLAMGIGMAGWVKVARPKTELQDRLAWMQDYPQSTIRIIGLLELAAAVGLVVPTASGFLPILTPWAAIGVGILMVLVMVVHARRGESRYLAVNVVVLMTAAFIAWGRLSVLPG